MNVLLLTRAECAACAETKRLLDRFATQLPISVSTLDLDSLEGQALAERGGVLFPPGIFLDGEAVAYGRLSERKLRREIERRLRVSEYCVRPPDRLTRLRRGIERRLVLLRRT